MCVSIANLFEKVADCHKGLGTLFQLRFTHMVRLQFWRHFLPFFTRCYELTIPAHPTCVGKENLVIHGREDLGDKAGKSSALGGVSNRVMLFELRCFQFPHHVEPAIYISLWQNVTIGSQQVSVGSQLEVLVNRGLGVRLFGCLVVHGDDVALFIF